MDQILDALRNAEEVAESILSDRQEIIDLDKKRNQNREALRLMKKINNREKLWFGFGNMFMKTTINSANDILNKDQIQINERIDELRNELKTKVNQLRQLEGEEVLKSFDLKALNKEEINAIQQLL